MNPFYEVTMKLLGYNPDNEDNFETAQYEIEDKLYEKYEIDEENFEKLLSDLVKLTPVVKTALGGQEVQGFVDTEKQMFLYKQEYKK